MNYKIVSDSSSNLLSMDGIPYQSVPLHILVGEQSFTDDENLNLSDMIDALAAYHGKTSTACPSPDDWVQAFGDAEVIFCVTMTSTLSGTYNSAHMAKHMYEEAHPERVVYLIDSLSTGPEIVLLIEKIRELIETGMEADQIYEKVLAYHKTTHLYYSLASLKNLANNGRVSPLVAKGVGLLGIRIIGTASEEGTLKPMDKARGDKKAVQKLLNFMKSHGYCGGKVIISHSDNAEAAEDLKQRIISEFGTFHGCIQNNTGLCSYYAELHSVMVGFETQA